VDSVLSYCHYSLSDSSLESLIPYLESKGVGIINASLLSMGLLTEQVRKHVSSTSECMGTASTAASPTDKALQIAVC